MTATTATVTAQTRATTRTGGPDEDGPKVLEHVLGWTLVVVLAMLVTQIGLL
ncbi:SCO1431 family membrane protein [Streptomyces sp. NPDC048436]|uniref:SCO1431 family membrane protein n=1 Tax=Streptomyces sp. NPDC048436 TaxID=3365550 RepID=UPI003722465B